MNYKLIPLLLLTITQFSFSKIGQNELTAKIGIGTFEYGFNIKAPSIPTEFSASSEASGTAVDISGNLNLFVSEEEDFGVDITASYLTASGDDSVIDSSGDPFKADADFSVLNVSLRPYYNAGPLDLFVDVGLQTTEFDIGVNSDGTNFPSVKGENSDLYYGFGMEADVSPSLSFSPSISFFKAVAPSVDLSSASPGTVATFAKVDGATISLPVSYAFDDDFDISLSYELIKTDDSVSELGPNDTLTVKTKAHVWLIGASYKF